MSRWKDWLKTLYAKLEPEHDDRPSVIGGLKGTVTVAPGVDLTEPLWVVRDKKV